MLHCVAKQKERKKKKDRMLVICVKNGLCYFSERMCLPHFGAWNALCKNICIEDVSKDLVVYGELRECFYFSGIELQELFVYF